MSVDPTTLYTGTFKTGPGTIMAGGNSGYQAINLAVLLGAKRVVLLGYDMGFTDGKSHWHGDHPKQWLNNPHEGTFVGWRHAFEVMAESGDLEKAGCEVLNATRTTALECFPRVKLEDVV